jgi:hypothetical protein
LDPARAAAQPVFLPLHVPRDATLWTILSWVSAPLHGVSRTSRQRHLCRRHLSWGFNRPYSAYRRRESTSVRSPCGPRSGLPGVTGVVRQRVPPRRLRCRSQVFPTSQRLLPLPAPSPFSDEWRSWGSPYRGLLSVRSLDDSSPSTYPRDVPPADCAVPVPRRGHPWALLPLPRMLGMEPFFVFRVFVLAQIGPQHRHCLGFRCPTCPSWACASSWFRPAQLPRASAPCTVTASPPPACRQTCESCASRLVNHASGPSLPREPTHPKVPRLRRLPLFE